MDDVGEPAYLEPRHIQLGFYWHDVAETEAYCIVLQCLLANGYGMHDAVVAIRAHEGKLARFDQLVTHGLPKEDVALLRDWTPERVAAERDWLPVRVRLIPLVDDNVEVDLGYAPLLGESLRGGDARVIEVTASGADLNLLDNCDPENQRPEIVEHGRKTDRWHRVMFQRVCEECEPDYAACDWENALQPPKSLLAFEMDERFPAIFVSDRLVGDALGKRAGRDPELAEWATKRFRNGVYSGWRIDADPEISDTVGTFVRNLIRERFVL